MPTPQRAARQIVKSEKESAASSSDLSSPPKSPRELSAVRKPPTLRTAEAEIVTIQAFSTDRESQKVYKVHKAFITYYSAYFNAAFSGPFSESTSQTITYETVSLEAFGSYMDWVYTQNIQDRDGGLPCINQLIYLWSIADMTLTAKLQNQVLYKINELVAQTKKLPTDMFAWIYANTVPGSPLRRIFVDLCIFYKEPITVEQDFPREMLVDLVTTAAEHHSRKTSKISNEKMQKYLTSEE